MQTSLTAYLLIALALNIGIILLSFTRQDRRRSLHFSILALAMGCYVLGYLVEVSAVTADGVIAALRVENLGIHLLGPFFLLTVLGIFNYRRLKAWMVPAALAYGAVMFMLVFFNHLHHLYYTSIEMVFDGRHYFPQLEHGFLYYVHQFVGISCMLAAYSVLFYRFFTGGKKTRRQMLLILSGSVIVLITNLANFVPLLPVGLDPIPFSLTFALLLFSIDLYYHKLLDIVPIASSAAVEFMDDAMVVLDENLGYQYANDTAKSLFPGIDALFVNESVAGIPNWPAGLSAIKRPGQVTFSISVNGSEKFYRASVSGILGVRNATIGWSVVMRDITEMISMMNQLELMATTDPLTGIYNRHQLLRMVALQLEVAKRHEVRMWLVMFDLDRFKRINDTYGHPMGDRVLTEVTATIKKHLRPYDIFARYGGEEFVVFTTGFAENNLGAFVERLRASIDNLEIAFGDEAIHVTASFGAVEIGRGWTMEEAFATVDKLMYQAKSDGRNRVVSELLNHARAE